MLAYEENHVCEGKFTCEEKACIQCRRGFTWTCGEQEFIHKLHEEWLEGQHRDDPNAIKTVTPPKRCHECRMLKKKRYERN